MKIIRSDNGGEYSSNGFAELCAEKEILHEFINPYNPEPNGVTERLNRTVMEAARSVLYKANLPLNFWAEACSVAVYLHNRSPAVALKDQTPFECLFGTKPDVSNLRVFGCMCETVNVDAKAHKKSFVGYRLV